MNTTFARTVMGGLLGGMVALGSLCHSHASETSFAPPPPTTGPVSPDAPIIQFETNSYDFGKIIAPGEISGVFKFKNVGKSPLKVERPAPSCNCTESKVTPDTVAPGQSGEIIYTIKLEQAFHGQKSIKVHSNDPRTPEVLLTMLMDYKPLYEVLPKALRVVVPAGEDSAEGSFTITRTDGQPLAIEHFTASHPWVTAALEPGRNPLENAAKVNVKVRRPADPSAMMSATLQMWGFGQTNRSMQTVLVMAEMQGELVADPSKLYWVIPDFGSYKTNYPAASLTRTIALKSVLGKPVQIKNATCSIKGLDVKVVSKDAGKAFDLVLQFDDVPKEFANGKVLVETSIASLPKVEIPLTVAVPSGN